MAQVLSEGRLTIFDFALVRQARWREAIASIFDLPEFLPYLRSIRRIAVTYASHDETLDVSTTNVVKPVYHVAWMASRLDFSVAQPLHVVEHPGRHGTPRGFAATLRDGRGQIAVVIRPITSPMPSGTTLRVELLAERRGSELRADVTAEAESVRVRVWQDGVESLDRSFHAPRRTEVELLAEAIEAGGPDHVAHDAIRFAGALVGPVPDRPVERAPLGPSDAPRSPGPTPGLA
jgi:hypothetical protein